MPDLELDNLGLLHGCGSHWRLEHGAVMGVHGDGTQPSIWLRECAIAAEDLNIAPMHHQMLGYAVYIALPLELTSALELFADRIVIWLGRISHGGYSATLSLSLYRRGIASPQLIDLDNSADLANRAIAETQKEMVFGGLLNDDEYTKRFRANADKLFEEWWGRRLNAMAQLAMAMMDWSVKYPHKYQRESL